MVCDRVVLVIKEVISVLDKGLLIFIIAMLIMFIIVNWLDDNKFIVQAAVILSLLCLTICGLWPSCLFIRNKVFN